MNRHKKSFLRRAFSDQRGQVLPIVAFSMVALLGMGGAAIDVGHLYCCFNELQAAANAAALAGAQSLPASTATAAATTYSAVPGSLNAHGNLPNVTMVSGYPQAVCLAALTSESMPCIAPANANAMVVKQQVAVKTYFAGLFGVPSITLTATAAAAMRGGATPPYNVAIIVDTTESMTDKDSESSCDASRISCSLTGIQSLLKELTPCASSESTCGTATSGNVANSVDRVSLFTFPNMVTTTVSEDYDCSSSNPTIEPYTFPPAGASSLTTMPYTTTTTTTSKGKTTTTSTTVQMTYQIVDYSSDYRASDTTASLNASSDIVVAVGGKSGCAGIGAPGGDGTYYAGAIYAAQASLVGEQLANPGSQNVIILLSDGDAGACGTTSQSGCNSIQMAEGTTSTTVATSNGLYASWINQCHQAITAAQAATTAGTRVYTVAYGAEASGCTFDSPSITPCETMEQMASTAATFFSDYAATGGTGNCISASRPTTSLDEIFSEIGGDFTTSRLIPNNLLE